MCCSRRRDPRAIALEALVSLGIALFLLVAGMEVNLSMIRRQGRLALAVSVWGMVLPFALGLGAVRLAPGLFVPEGATTPVVHALFFATALSISALPVIARTLMGLNLYRTDFGAIVIAAAFINDLAGWIVFSMVVGMAGVAVPAVAPLAGTAALVIVFSATMLTGGRWLADRGVRWVQTHTAQPAGVLAYALSLALIGSAFTEWIGVHAILGAFLAGVAIGDSRRLHDSTRNTVRHFVSSFFAPLFFASIGLRLDFLRHFDLALTAAVVVVASAGKLLGCRVSVLGTSWTARQAWAIGFALNARGAMEIVLGLLAFQLGIISQSMLVALVVMALVTSMISGPMIRVLLGIGTTLGPRTVDYRGTRIVLHDLGVTRGSEAMRDLARAAAASADVTPGVAEAVLVNGAFTVRAELAPRIALYGAGIRDLPAPLIVVGVVSAAAGTETELIIVVLSLAEDSASVLGELATLFASAEVRAWLLRTRQGAEAVALFARGQAAVSSS